MKKMGIWFLLIALALIFLIGIKLAQSFYRFARQDETMNSFLPYISEYLNTPFVDQYATKPYLSGKVVTVDVDRRIVDTWTYPKLAEAIRAKNPQEVGTLVLIKWGREKIGDYQNVETGERTGEAFRGKASLTVIDWNNKFKLAEEVITGEEPATALRGKGNYESQQPMFKILAYLKRLPQK